MMNFDIQFSHLINHSSQDGHLDGEQFLTSGMDNFIKIWTIKSNSSNSKVHQNKNLFLDHQDLVEKSENWDSSKERRNFPTAHLQYPTFSTK